MQEFDVVIVGAGPAGGQCARILAQQGKKILLVERQKTFWENNFSSGVCPQSVLEDFKISKNPVKSDWNQIEIKSTKWFPKWRDSENLGVVFEFAELREFLAQEVQVNGGEFWRGCSYLKHSQQGDRAIVFLKLTELKETISVSTKILVDATGFTRAVIYPKKERPTNFIKANGFEYLIEVDRQTYQEYAKKITFLLGHRWAPRGYAWIFPMQENRLKVGMMHYNEPHKHLKIFQPAPYYARKVIEDFLKPQNYKVINAHGSKAEYSKGLNDRYYQDNIIVIGDGVSTINFLGFEGIRHAFRGVEVACQSIEAYLKGEIFSFELYQNQMQAIFQPDWNESERIARKVYLEYQDWQIDLGIFSLYLVKLNNLLDILFYYNFGKYSKKWLKSNFWIVNSFLNLWERLKRFITLPPQIQANRKRSNYN